MREREEHVWKTVGHNIVSRAHDDSGAHRNSSAKPNIIGVWCMENFLQLWKGYGDNIGIKPRGMNIRPSP